MKKLGLIGLSEGNGHPYSFGTIINGYNEHYLKLSGWDVIYNYVTKRDVSEIGIENARISHVWTQDKNITKNLSLSCNIDNTVDNFKEMLGKVDGIIIARDDFENHLQMAKPFLETGTKVFVDKPLTLDIDELRYYKKYIDNGQLMSMSGMRYALELDDIRSNLDRYGELKLIQSSVINDGEKYGVHILDAVLSILPFIPTSITYIPNGIGSYVIEFENGLTWTINVLDDSPKTFNINIWGKEKRSTFEIVDNFSMFRRLLWRFVKLVDKNEQYYKPHDMLVSLCLLIGGNISKDDKRKVYLTEFNEFLS